MAPEGCGSGNFVKFVDAISLLHLIQVSIYNAAENMIFEGKLKATDHGKRDETVMIHSFEVELSVMSRRESASGITRDNRSLPSFPTYK